MEFFELKWPSSKLYFWDESNAKNYSKKLSDANKVVWPDHELRVEITKIKTEDERIPF